MLALSAGATQAGDVTPTVDLRYRFENVNDDAFASAANAHTLRARLGLNWKIDERWRLFGALESTSNISNDFNSSRNGHGDRPLVADPKNTELDQLYVAYSDGAFGATLGRQAINLDNQRYIGAVGWRQNEQTFDALAISYQFNDRFTGRYDYLAQAIRIFGDDHPNELLAHRDLEGHLLNLSARVAHGTLTGYGYLVEDRDVESDSNATWGLRYVGKGDDARPWGLSLDLARQSDYADSPLDYSAGYWAIEPSYRFGKITLKAGYEALGADAGGSFRTPLATGHAFNGWADRFLSTPANGLDDLYVGAAGPLGKGNWSVTWHDFSAARGSADYGSEFDAHYARPLGHGFTGLVKYANYQSNGFGADVTKLWLQIEYKR